MLERLLAGEPDGVSGPVDARSNTDEPDQRTPFLHGPSEPHVGERGRSDPLVEVRRHRCEGCAVGEAESSPDAQTYGLAELRAKRTAMLVQWQSGWPDSRTWSPAWSAWPRPLDSLAGRRDRI